MSAEPTDEELNKKLEETAAALCEHFDSVLVLASRSREGKTMGLTRGGGDWFAQYGLVMDWLNRQKARENANEMRGVMPQDPPDDGEAWKQG